MPTNEILPFCPTDNGSNLLSESAYLASADRTSGNKTGNASAQLVNKALRQSSYIAACVAQIMANVLGTDVVDDATPDKVNAQFLALVARIPVKTTVLGGGSTGTYNPTFYFYIVAGNATIGATYTHNSITYTVVTTISGETTLKATGNGIPLASGTLTKASGTGDGTITFYAMRAPVSLAVVAQAGGGGGGGGGAGSSGGVAGGTGGSTTFGTISTTGGFGGGCGTAQQAGGTVSVTGAWLVLTQIAGQVGGGFTNGNGTAINCPGGVGGPSPFAGAGAGGGSSPSTSNVAGFSARDGSGSGGGGASRNGGTDTSGSGGAAGGYVSASLANPVGGYAYSVGSGGLAGTYTTNGGNGGSGALVIREIYQ